MMLKCHLVISQNQEKILIRKVNGNKFWGAVGYIISEHGEEIINAAVDLK